MTAPLISVIVPAHNAAAFLPDAIGSLRQQPNLVYEIIVVDDGSTDQTADLAQRLGGDLRVIRQAQAGANAARIRGAAEARGDFIAFLDADDWFPPGSLTARAHQLAADPALDAAGGFIQMVTMPGAAATMAHDARRQRNIPYLNVNLGAALFRRRVFDQIGGFAPDLTFAEDVDWMLRAWEYPLRWRTLRRVTLMYRRHATNMTTDARLAQINQAAQIALARSSSRRGAPTDYALLERYLLESVEPPPDSPPLTVTVIVAGQGGTPDALAQTLASVQTQTRPPDALVVLENADSLPAARSAAVDAARTDLVAFIDAGALWHADKLALQADYLRQAPYLEYVVSRPADMPTLWAFPLSALMARRTAFAQIGGFNPRYPLMSAADWFTRAQDAHLAYDQMDTPLLRALPSTPFSPATQRELAHIYSESIKRRRAAARTEP